MTTIPPGWVDLKRAAQDAAGCPPPRRRSGRSREKGRVRGAALDARGRLLLDITSSQPERARGAAAGAHAVSAEICDRCGGPGDPVRLASTWTRTTRCEYCRGAADEVLPRPPWRRHRDVAREIPDPTANDHSHRSMPVIERILTDQNLSALMEGRDVGSGWPNTDGNEYVDEEFVGGIFGLPYWLMHSANGWCPLIRAFFTLVLPMQCEGQARPARVIEMAKSYRQGEREPELAIAAHNFDDYRWGIAHLVTEHSRRTCCDCGLLQTDVAGVTRGPGRRCSCGGYRR